MRITSARKLAPVVLMLSMTLVPAMTFAGDVGAPGGLLNGALDLTYVGHLEKKDGDGRLLVWEGSVGGDFAGTIRWWFADQASTKFVGGQVFYYRARWEIRVGEELVLAGDSAGKTVTLDGLDGMWDGHGVVTEAYGIFAQFKGYKVYETGPVIQGSNPPASFTGTGMFQIY